MVLDEVGEQIEHFWFEVHRRPCQAEHTAVGVEFVGPKDVDHGLPIGLRRLYCELRER